MKLNKQYEKLVKTNYGNRHFIYIKCTNCGKITLYDKYIYNKNKRGFCLDNPYCKYEFFKKQKDPKLVDILKFIDTPNFCYLIGLIVSDGHIVNTKHEKHKSYECNIELHNTDKKLLLDIQNLYGGVIYELKSGMNRISFKYKPFIEYLTNIVKLSNNKTRNIPINNWFSNLSNENKNHFIRGVIDGDGCIRKNKQGYWNFTLTTNARTFIKLLYKHFGNLVNYNEYKNGLTSIYNSSKNFIESLKPIYNINPNIYLVLERKYNKYQTALKEVKL